MTTALLLAALDLRRQGYYPVPVPAGRKRPSIRGWQVLRLTEAEIPKHFGGGGNIGVILGEASGGLTDADIDATEALAVAHEYLPATPRKSGRAGRPGSHWWYRSTVEKTHQYRDPLRPEKEGMLIEIRSTGGQTLVPPSIHPSGEDYVWHVEGDPADVAADELLSAAAKIAAVALLARYWPGQGSRHHASLALAGVLLRGGMAVEEAKRIVYLAALVGGDDEADDRPGDVETTAQQIDSGGRVTGAAAMAELMDEKVVTAVREWLRLTESGTVAPWPEPTPLPPLIVRVPALDPELIPEPLRAWIADVAERQQCAIDYPAAAAMVAAGSVIGRSLGIRPRQHDDWTITPNLWGAVIGRPSAGKSPALDAGLAPLRRLAAEARTAHEAAIGLGEADIKYQRACAEGREKAAKQKIEKAIKEGRQPDEGLRDEFVIEEEPLPTLRRYETSDPTIEKLGELLAENPRGILLFRDELTGWLRTLDREDRGQDRAFYLEAWSGLGQFTSDRIGRGTVHIPAACVSVLGGIQPGPLAAYVWGAMAGGQADDGLLQRFQVLVWPDVPAEYRTVDRWPDAAAQDRAWKVFSALAGLDPPQIGGEGIGGSGGAQIAHIRFSTAAQPIFTDWHETLMRRLRAGEEHPAMEAHLAKYPRLAPALALISHLIGVVDGAEPGPVSEESLLRALAWCEYLEAHARRVYGQVVARSLHAAHALARRLDSLPEPFTARHVYRQGWTGLATAEAVTEALELLAEHGWVRAGRTVAGEHGGRPSTQWHRYPGIGGGA